ncbi:prephenate dehydrogenase/arogenate dehydrogenase family protein [Halobacteriovorax sp. HLS]|uniref:prephenate dehydrogenase/arogenate dehydrogenase family protein n=1 Tax=Halobacteriovorax sp. HLS TaxID=2234000 RepID=UPI000FD82ACA|nr:prephenate dehydrogenase/arogenate dehydrogenase family protein [Halobacteriovorax sp. HLS]
MKIGVIGFGRLGKLLVRNISQDASVAVFDINIDTDLVSSMGAKSVCLEEVCKSKILILCVPISKISEVANQIKDHITPDTLIIDVCSVKVYPMEELTKRLPENIQILGTHPMFGPDSAAKSLYGCKIVLCPERVSDKVLKDIQGYLESHGLKVIVSTAHEHDEQIAQTLILTHTIGRTLMDMNSMEMEIDTKGYRRLLKILETVENDSVQLFNDMNKYNPYAKKMRSSLSHSLSKVLASVEE